MKEYYKKDFAFTCVELASYTKKMVKIMKECHPGLQITDLADASKTKSAAEVTKMFVESASYILRATVGGKKSPAASKRKAAKSGKALWDDKKLKVDDFFSCISYLHVTKIDGNQITVKNHLGGSWFITKDILLRDMWSGDHFEKEIKCTMTDLSQILEQCADTIFKVQFRKKIDEKEVEKKLNSISFADMKKSDKLKALSKNVTEGELCEITGHLINSENNMGRSTVIDLNAPIYNNFR